MPAMNDNEGIISLFTDDDKLIDRFNYRQDYHFKLYHDFEGVSLERIDPFKPTNDPSNWLSASEQAGFGTPGKKNSCSRPDRVIDGNILIVPVFSYRGILLQMVKPGLIIVLRIRDMLPTSESSIRQESWSGK